MALARVKTAQTRAHSRLDQHRVQKLAQSSSRARCRREGLPSAVPRTRGRRQVVCAEASSPEDFEIPKQQQTGSDAWRRRPAAVTLPAFARRPEQTFALAAVLKILLLSSMFPISMVFTPFGIPLRGVYAWLVLIPAAAVLAAIAVSVGRSNFLRRRGSGFLIAGFAALALAATSKLYTWAPPTPAPTPVAAGAREANWREELFDSSEPRSAEDSDKIWEELDREAKLGKRGS